MSGKTRTWKVSYEIETVDHEWLPAQDGGLFHRVPDTHFAPGGGRGYTVNIPGHATVEDITPVLAYPNGTVLRRGPGMFACPGTYLKHGGRWHFTADSGLETSAAFSADFDTIIRARVERGIYVLIHQPAGES